MLQPSKNTKKAAGTGKKIVKASAISKILSNIPFADEVYDVANTLEGFKEGDYKKIGSNFIGALIPGVSGKAFEAIAEDWLPATPEIEKKKMQFNLKSSPAERKKYLKKYGPGYLSNPQFIKDYKLAYGTGEDGINPNKPWLAPSSSIYQDPNFDFLNQTQEPIDFSKPQLESQGFADIGVSKNTGKFNVGSGINFNPESLAARVGASFNDKGFNSALNYTQGERGLSEVNVNAGYGNDFIQGEIDYFKTNNGDSLLGNLNIGDDKLRLLLSYLKDSEGTNLKGGFENTTDLNGGLLNSAIELDTNFEDPKISGRVNYTNPTGRLNLNAGASYSEGEKANFNAGLNYSFALGTDKNGIMKSKMNPRKKYANGSSAKGMNTNNYIISPSEALNDYNIMLAKVEQEAASNPWLPIVAMAGQAMQTGIGIAGGAASAKAATGVNDPNSPNYKPKKTAAMGMNDVEQDVEVEGGEMYETPQGQVGEFQGPSHEQGGIPLEVGEDVEEGTKVYSDRLKVGKKTLAERKETRERQIANLEKTASQPLVDQAVKNAVKRKMMALEREEAADLDFQDKVNNMQTMADTMVAAFGTGMTGLQDNPIGDSMRYGYGTSANGVMKYKRGGIIGDPWKYIQGDANLNGIVDTEENPANRLLNANKALEDYLNSPEHKKAGTALDSVIDKTEPDTKAMVQTGTLPSAVTTLPGNTSKTTSPIVNTGKTGAPGFVDGFGMDVDQTEEGVASTQAGTSFKFNPIDIPTLDLKVPNVAENAMNSLKTEDPFAMTAGEDWAAKPENAIPEGMGVPMAAGIDFKSDFFPGGFGTGTKAGTGTAKEAGKKGPSGFMKALSGSIPGVGDLTKMVGNYLGMTAGIKTAAEQRSTDITHTNVYKNAGKESQKLLDNAKQGIETSKAQAIVKATDVSRGGKRGGRNSARGVNQMRAMDWLYDSALQQQVADISAKAAEQMSGIDVQKSSVAMNADQLKGQGEYQAAMANEAAKDAYYTALGKGRNQFAEGLMQSGKDLNDMKENKLKWNMQKKSGSYLQGNDDGTFSNKDIEYTDASGKKVSIPRAEWEKLMTQYNKTKKK